MTGQLSTKRQQVGFAAHWALWLITFVVVPVTAGLGIWQSGRADEKRIQLELFEAKRNSPAVDLEQVWDLPAQQLAYLPVTVTGQIDNQRTLFIANRSFEGKRGYHLISPLLLSSGAGTVFLDRGWLPAKDYSDELPKIELIEREQTVSAEIYVRSDKDYIIGDNNLREGWPRVAQSGDTDFFHQEFVRLYPHMLRVKDDQPLIKQSNWVIANITPEKHMAYAVQWFAIAAVWIMIFISLGLKAKKENE